MAGQAITPSDKTLYRIADNITRPWLCRGLAVELDLPMSVVEKAADEMKNPCELAYHVLTTWREQLSYAATGRALHNALLQLRKRDLADEFEEELLGSDAASRTARLAAGHNPHSLRASLTGYPAATQEDPQRDRIGVVLHNSMSFESVTFVLDREVYARATSLEHFLCPYLKMGLGHGVKEITFCECDAAPQAPAGHCIRCLVCITIKGSLPSTEDEIKRLKNKVCRQVIGLLEIPEASVEVRLIGEGNSVLLVVEMPYYSALEILRRWQEDELSLKEDFTGFGGEQPFELLKLTGCFGKEECRLITKAFENGQVAKKPQSTQEVYNYSNELAALHKELQEANNRKTTMEKEADSLRQLLQQANHEANKAKDIAQQWESRATSVFNEFQEVRQHLGKMWELELQDSKKETLSDSEEKDADSDMFNGMLDIGLDMSEIELQYLPSVPEEDKYDHQMIAYGDWIVLLGGMNISNAACRLVHAFHTVEQEWFELPNTPYTWSAAASDGDHLYIIGGQTAGGDAVSNVYRLSDNHRQWVSLASSPLAVHHCSAAFCQKFLYVFSGQPQCPGLLQRCSVEEGMLTNWEQLTSAPNSLCPNWYSYGLISLGTRLITDNMCSYNTSTSSWDALSNKEEESELLLAIVQRQLIWVKGTVWSESSPWSQVEIPLHQP